MLRRGLDSRTLLSVSVSPKSYSGHGHESLSHRQFIDLFGPCARRGFATKFGTASDAFPPARKAYKETRKQDRIKRRHNEIQRTDDHKPSKHHDWDLTIGIEVHAQLNVDKKLFSSAAASINDAPNTHVAIFDGALPGSQPHFQIDAIIPALRAATALNCNIQRLSRFDRKHYFYRDQPAGYQITQYYEPFARDGRLQLLRRDGIDAADGEQITTRIKQVQMEQDTAKTLQQPSTTDLVDFNRVSFPLIEIITMPDIHHPATAAACVRKIQAILKAAGACIQGMDLGGLRADVNVSVQPKNRPGMSRLSNTYAGVVGLGQRTEIKNLSSFKTVEEAIEAERDRQIDVLEAGGSIIGETRGWTLGSSQTSRLRGKEGEVDYRYMPDPDIAPIIVSQGLLDHVRQNLPLLPDAQVSLLLSSPYNLSVKDSKTLIVLDDGERVDYYRDVVSRLHNALEDDADDKRRSVAGRTAGNWVLHELGGLLAQAGTPWGDNPVSEESLADIVALLLQGRITGRTAKQLLASLFAGETRSIPRVVADDNLLLRPMSDAEYQTLADSVLQDNPDIVTLIRSEGQNRKMQYLIGQMMRRGEDGRIEAVKAEECLLRQIRLR
ncbi:MAG: hypothetical protein M1817_004334 [Caeruleum heppii]|nr:MAG: hypothetical protein M1817_004334 [Caeruleum heppii]